MSVLHELASQLSTFLVGDADVDAVPAVLELDDLRAPGSTRPRVLALNWHHAPAGRSETYAEQLALLRGCRGVDEAGLRALLDGSDAELNERPVVLPMLYEGYRSGYEQLLPLVEALGLTAWLVVPPGVVDCPVAEQAAFAAAHELEPSADDDPRIAMSWDELRDVVARGHVVCCHTATHCAQAEVATPADAERELVASRARLEAELGRPVRSLAFLWGPAWGADPSVDARVLEAGYDLLLADGRIQRLPHAA